MGMLLPTDEPEAGPWREVPLAELVDLLRESAGAPEGRPAVVAVDGRSASGKSTLAATLSAAVRRSAVVSTDDVAWHHCFFDWAELLASGILEPARRGENVHYRPPAWDRRGRAGAIEVASGLDLLLVEGVGAGRRLLEPLLDAAVWLQADLPESERRGLDRDVARNEHGTAEAAVAFWHEWMAEELAFLSQERPWERACVVVAGTPPWPCADGHVIVAPAPAGDESRPGAR